MLTSTTTILALLLLASCGGPKAGSSGRGDSWKEAWHQPQTRLPEKNAKVTTSESAVSPAPHKTSAPGSDVLHCSLVEVSPAPSADFERAERFYKLSYLPFQFASTLNTKRQADRELGTLTTLARAAQEKYAIILQGATDGLEHPRVEGSNGAYWRIAAHVRSGEISAEQARKIRAIPAPNNPAWGVKYSDAIDAIVEPLDEQAQVQWEAASRLGAEWCIASEWTRLAQDHLGQR